MRRTKRPKASFLRPDHLGVSVADLKASIAWYRDMLGFELVRALDIPDAEDSGRVALMRHGDFILELFCVPGAVPLPNDRREPASDIRTHGVKHLAYAVADIEAVMARLKGRGVDVAWDIVVHDGDRCAFVRDPTGNLVEFVERPGA